MLNYATNASGAPATNRILNVSGSTAVSHDAAGNLTQEGTTTYSYDAANRLKEVGSGGQNVYGYDGDGRRVRKVSAGGSPLYFIWSTILGEVAFEARESEAAIRVYLYAGRQQIAIRGTDRGFYWVHPDHLGSLKKLTRTNGTVAYRVEYDPHGQRVLEWSDVSTNLDSHKFTGHEWDFATNLEYAKARMYNHNRGRFTKPDQLGLRASDPKRPQTLNRYTYVNNDPVNYVDRNGLFAQAPNPGTVDMPRDLFGTGGGGDGMFEIDELSYDESGGGSIDHNSDLLAAITNLPSRCKLFISFETRKTEIMNLIAAITFHDARNPGNATFKVGPNQTTRVDSFWRIATQDLPDEPYAIIATDQRGGGHREIKTIILGANYFNGSQEKQITVLRHEFLHILYDKDDIALAKEFKAIGAVGFDDIDFNMRDLDLLQDITSKAITAFIEGGCQTK
ncbi:MAG: hypothetical protein KIT57_24490 [Blastocatellales bacterium]|nr:hypothetical protein [Blastocatellales bacterium]